MMAPQQTLSESFALVWEHETLFVDAVFTAVVLATVNVGANIVQNSQMHSAIKATAILCLYFASKALQGEGSGGDTLRKTVSRAYIFSFIGDVSLLLKGYEDARWNQFFFIVGLLSFLTGHLLFVIGFSNGFDPDYSPSVTGVGTLMTIGLPIYYIMFTRIRGIMLFFVMAYIVTINCMLLAALGFYQRDDNILVLVGAVLFTISDTLLGMGKFVLPEKYGVVVGRGPIMLTYYCAQICFALSLTHRYTPPPIQCRH